MFTLLRRIGVLLGILVLAAATARSELRVPSIFSSNALLQRDGAVPVWGRADPGETVEVEFAGQRRMAVANSEGRWKATLDPMPASLIPRTLSIRSKTGGAVVSTNVLVGDVWVLAGQSNMGWSLGQSKGAEAAKARANYPWLRSFSQWPYQGVADRVTDDVKGGAWNVCAPGNAGHISGVGFFFAEALHPHTGVPVALVQTAMGGTYLESWLDPGTLGRLPEGKPYLEMAGKAGETHERDFAAWTLANDAWEKEAKAAREAGRPAPAPLSVPQPFLGPDRFRRPGGLYLGKVAPLQPFAIRGVLWYQGEGNANPAMAPHYEVLLRTLIQTWRRDWGQGDFPFLVVQLPDFNAGDWSLLREAQVRAVAATPKTGLAITIDTGEPDEIHPANKQLVGERLARLARVVAYGEKIVGTGPIMVDAVARDGGIVVRFDHAGGGLKSRGGVLRGFELRAKGGTYLPARAEIVGANVVRIFADGLAVPAAARYAWKPAPDGNLYNDADLPTAPFRTARDD